MSTEVAASRTRAFVRVQDYVPKHRAEPRPSPDVRDITSRAASALAPHPLHGALRDLDACVLLDEVAT